MEHAKEWLIGHFGQDTKFVEMQKYLSVQPPPVVKGRTRLYGALYFATRNHPITLVFHCETEAIRNSLVKELNLPPHNWNATPGRDRRIHIPLAKAKLNDLDKAVKQWAKQRK